MMNDELVIIHVFVLVDDIVNQLSLDAHPGPSGQLAVSEVLTILILHPLLKPGQSLKAFHRWIEANAKHLFPALVEYSRFTRLSNQVQEFLVIVLQQLAHLDSFGLIADGTTVATMKVIRGPHAKSFRNARKVYCASKNQWDWGFILELMLDQQGQIAFFSLGTAAEVRQIEDILEDLANRWVLCDRGNRSQEMHDRMWQDKQIRIKMTGGKERQWIENVIGALKDRLGLDRIRVRKMPAFLTRLKAILCAYNVCSALHLAI